MKTEHLALLVMGLSLALVAAVIVWLLCFDVALNRAMDDCGDLCRPDDGIDMTMVADI